MDDKTARWEFIEDEDALSRAVEGGDWNKARHLAAIKVAKMIEKTDSPREVKALSVSLENLISACEREDVTDANDEIARILRKRKQLGAEDGR